MILVGELEYTDKMMAPDGNTGWLWVGTQFQDPVMYCYSISPYPDEQSKWLGDNYKTVKCLSVTEFLQQHVNTDLQLGVGVVKHFKEDVGIRLKGMDTWITRK
jgi:hypothetical protein